jgi:hypothetical protein
MILIRFELRMDLSSDIWRTRYDALFDTPRQKLSLCARVQHARNYRQPRGGLDYDLGRIRAGRWSLGTAAEQKRMFAMTHSKKIRSPHALVGSAVGTTLVSIAAAWLATSLAFAPVVANPDTPSADASKSYTSSPRHLYQLSPIPPGADWTS